MLTDQIKNVFNEGLCYFFILFYFLYVQHICFYVALSNYLYILTGLLEFIVHMVNTERTVIFYPCTLILLMLFLQMYKWVILGPTEAREKKTKRFS